MGNVILFIITMVLIAIAVYFFYKGIQKSDSEIEKIIDYILGIIAITILIIYYIDRFNIPSQLGWSDNVNSQNWLNLIGNYSIGVISAGIGAITSVYVTIHQIEKNNEISEHRDKENMRIQNMPMLKYTIQTNINHDGKSDEDYLLCTKFSEDSKYIYDMNIAIKNIGLNNVKRIIVDLESSMLEGKCNRIFGGDSIIPIEKNEEIEIYKYFALESDNEYVIELNFYYEDVLQNWYKQRVRINYNATNCANTLSPSGIIDYKISEEELLNKVDIINN